ncbi:MAG: UDP-N-acetylmuramate dehydrogenase [Bacteroidetes bacterium]|nr:UDP-N-acetylmuramate dehydrogenase [Bacteroidota bacterium]MBU1717786.1 UDP-N-acetylmuramate dehydrogenase [Bacteroidota bacterium]
MKTSENIGLKDFNTFHSKVKAQYFTRLGSMDDVVSTVSNFDKKIPLLVLGGGSNILFTKNFDGMVARMEMKGIEITDEDADNVYIKAMAGESWNDFVQFTLGSGLSGAETLIDIPGTVGASPIQNIGAYGHEVAEIIHNVCCYHIPTHTTLTISNRDCHFGYRNSLFKQSMKGRVIITSVQYKLNKHRIQEALYKDVEEWITKKGKDRNSIHDIATAVRAIRKDKLPDPEIMGNAGSFFKNPLINNQQFFALQKLFPDIPSYQAEGFQKKIPAAWLIDQCGWKGYRKGDTGVHARQPLVLVNFGNAQGSEIYDLAKQIRQSVIDSFGISLDFEVNIL